MSLWIAILAGYLLAMAVTLLFAACLARVAKEADEHEARLRRAQARRGTPARPRAEEQRPERARVG